MSKRWLISFASVAALAAFSLTPAVAQAIPQFRINGVLAGASKQNVVQFGTITMKSPFFGEIKCNVLVGAPVGNESEKGVASVEGWQASGCRMPECIHGPASVIPEGSPRILLNGKHEIIRGPERGETTLPWPAHTVMTPEATTALKMGSTEKVLQPVKFLVNCPSELFEVPYEGTLEPRIINGTKNGLKPSHLEFEGSGGKTGHLLTPDICGGTCASAELFLSGSLTMLGTSQQLVTAEQLPPPTFAGLKSASMCFPGATMPETAAVHLGWEAATDDVTPSAEIVYNVYQASTSGGENYSTPTYTTAPGATQFETPKLPTRESHFFVVRARDKAGLEDSNTVERQAQNICV